MASAHPILAFAPNPAKPDAPFPGNGALQSVLQALQPTVLFPPNVKALLAGHVVRPVARSVARAGT